MSEYGMPRYFRSDGAETLGFPADEFEAPLTPADVAESAAFSFLPAIEVSPPKIVAEAFGIGFSQGL